ncbi:MAG: C69 family dipeptidase [Bacteroidales bacterium]|nr:C69 family dipeptidase [Candidatus Cacconaster merdequi]
MRHFLTSMLIALTIVFSSSVTLNSQTLDCFGIIAGCKATADGSVMMAHNEDDGGEQMLNIYAVPASKDNVRYLWFEFPRMEQADSFINEYGVCIASDGCGSREDKGELTDGGVLYEVRVAVAKKAHSAREAVSIIGNMVEKYGYRGSGRTYVIADTKEGWICSVVQGKHWVAQRVPDDCVMTIPNYYVIGKVDLSDKANFAGSPDIVDYAISRGWYNPAKDGEFSFRLAYASEKTLQNENNHIRHNNAYRHFFGREKGDREPIALKPLKPVTLEKMMEALSLPVICNKGTILATVFHLRGWLPLEEGCVAWNAMGRPNVSVFVPWYLGITEVPAGFGRYSTPAEAEAKHLVDNKDFRKNYPDHFYWKYVDSWDVLTKRDKSLQRKMFKAARKFDRSQVKDYNAFISELYK